jgi:outer membrane protein OmpA-like peptidoglycan-associated protein
MTKKYYKDIIFSVVTLFVFCSAAFSQSGLVQAIYFKSNSFSIDKKYKKTLDLIAKQINSDTFGYLKVFGYADKSGSENYNDILSEKRATAVYDYLSVRVKIDTTKVFVTWIGKSAEAYDLHFPAAHIQKRCVDIWVTFYRKPKN